jgi:hypothetical protein
MRSPSKRTALVVIVTLVATVTVAAVGVLAFDSGLVSQQSMTLDNDDSPTSTRVETNRDTPTETTTPTRTQTTTESPTSTRTPVPTTTIVDEETGVVVEISGEPDWADVVDLSEPSLYADDTPVFAGPTVRFERIRTEVTTNVTMTLPIAPGTALDDAVVYVRNDTGSSFWSPVPTTVDATNRSATATVSTVNDVTVMNQTAWQEGITEPDPTPIPAAELNGTCIENCKVENGTVIIGAFDGEPINDSERNTTDDDQLQTPV